MKKQKWTEHWQCGEDVQKLEDAPWKKEKSRRQEEGLLRLKEENLQTAARGYKDATGVVCDGFHP